MKRKSNTYSSVQMQDALIRTLDLLGDRARELLVRYLENYHDIFINDSKSFTSKKLESALEELFGAGTEILMRKFNSEVRKNNFRYIAKPKFVSV